MTYMKYLVTLCSVSNMLTDYTIRIELSICTCDIIQSHVQIQ